MAETVGLPLFSLSINFLFWAFASSSAKFVGCAFIFGADFQIYGGVCLCDGIQRGQRMESRTLASSSIDFLFFLFLFTLRIANPSFSFLRISIQKVTNSLTRYKKLNGISLFGFKNPSKLN